MSTLGSVEKVSFRKIKGEYMTEHLPTKSEYSGNTSNYHRVNMGVRTNSDALVSSLQANLVQQQIERETSTVEIMDSKTLHKNKDQLMRKMVLLGGKDSKKKNIMLNITPQYNMNINGGNRNMGKQKLSSVQVKKNQKFELNDSPYNNDERGTYHNETSQESTHQYT